jgi:RIO kinase 1
LHPDVELTGRFEHSTKPVDLDGVMREIDDIRAEEAARQLRLQEME